MDEEFSIDDKIHIIGNESQTIHIILEKNKKININKNYIIYASSENLDEIVYKNTDFFIDTQESIFSSNYKQKTLKKVENESIVRLKNKENNIEYIGLSKGGMIMKCAPLLYTNLFIKIDSILAFNDGVELLHNKEIDDKIHKINQNNYNMKNIIDMFIVKDNEFCVVKTKLSKSNLKMYDKESLSLLHISSYMNDFVYISTRGNLIEKRLGENETMTLMVNSIIAFEESISFSNVRKDNKKFKYLNNYNDIVVEGPGLVIFEIIPRKITITNSKRNRILIMIMIFLFIFQFIIYFIDAKIE